MATETAGQTRQERFETYNTYAVQAQNADHSDLVRTVAAQLAVAFEVSNLRAEIHFGSKGRSS